MIYDNKDDWLRKYRPKVRKCNEPGFLRARIFSHEKLIRWFILGHEKSVFAFQIEATIYNASLKTVGLIIVFFFFVFMANLFRWNNIIFQQNILQITRMRIKKQAH